MRREGHSSRSYPLVGKDRIKTVGMDSTEICFSLLKLTHLVLIDKCSMPWWCFSCLRLLIKNADGIKGDRKTMGLLLKLHHLNF
jgi:hypothetical protein